MALMLLLPILSERSKESVSSTDVFVLEGSNPCVIFITVPVDSV